jgi:membrane fusion protein, heavy metal efflux system
MTVRSEGILLLALLALACGGGERADEHGHAGDEHAEHAEHEGEGAEGGGEGIVAIDPEMRRDLRITTALSELRAGGEGVMVLGELRVNEEAYAEVGPAIPARAVRVLAAPGALVKTDDPLVELESADVGRARATRITARARARLAHDALARKRELVNDRIAARRELQEAQAEASAADAELRAAEAALGALGVAGEDARQDARFVLRSPVAGTVLERAVVQGQMVEPGRALFRVGDLATLWLVVQAFERDAVRVKAQDSARVAFPALPGADYSGRIALVGSQVDTSSRTIPIRIEVANPDGALRPGMSATAWLPLGDAGKPMVTVPAAALQRTQDGWSVFVPRADGAFDVRSVGRGRNLGNDVEVVSGLEAHETVVVEGAFLLKAELEKASGEGAGHEH